LLATRDPEHPVGQRVPRFGDTAGEEETGSVASGGAHVQTSISFAHARNASRRYLLLDRPDHGAGLVPSCRPHRSRPPALLRRPFRHRRGRFELLWAADPSDRPVVGGAHSTGLRLPRQGFRH